MFITKSFMDRIPEPELMENENQVFSYSEADFSEGENNFIDFMVEYLKRREISLSRNDLIIDLGCGPGNITEKLSLKWPYVNVIGIDGSKEMILKAESNKKQNNKNKKFDNLTYICKDIKEIELKDVSSKNELSLLVSNSFIHHITHIEEFFDCVVRLSSDETINFHKDLKRPIDERTAIEMKEKCSTKFDHILIQDYFASLKASYSTEELRKFIFNKKFTSMKVIDDGRFRNNNKII